MNVEKFEFPFDVDLLPVRKLKAGDIECLYERGNLRYVRYRGEEVIRMIYTAVRDERWATAPHKIEREVVEESGASFAIRYTAIYQLNDIHYRAYVRINLKENGISFSMEGEALSDFRRNRIGLCVLHPVDECKGKNVRISHPDGTTSDAVYPHLISPHQPFKQVQCMSWQAAGATINLQFEGDVFETEDQRNWTDFSYKTYSTPLDKPFPVTVKKGEQLRQKMTVAFAPGTSGAVQSATAKQPSFTAKLPFPKIGYERATGSPPLTPTDIQLLQAIPFNHYRVNLYLAEKDWKTELDIAAAEAGQLNASLEVAAFFPSADNEWLQQLKDALHEQSVPVRYLLLVQVGKPVVQAEFFEQAMSVIKAGLPELAIGYGTDGFFAELNRHRPAQQLPFDFLSFSLNPQVHADDTRTVHENLQAQADVLETAQSFAPGKAIHVSPVTFKLREERAFVNAEATEEDSRMYTSFGAMWTLLTLKNLAGAECITLYQVKSFRGILNEEIAIDQNKLYQILKQVKSFGAAWILAGADKTNTVTLENRLGEQLIFSLSDTGISI